MKSRPWLRSRKEMTQMTERKDVRWRKLTDCISSTPSWMTEASCESEDVFKIAMSHTNGGIQLSFPRTITWLILWYDIAMRRRHTKEGEWHSTSSDKMDSGSSEVAVEYRSIYAHASPATDYVVLPWPRRCPLYLLTDLLRHHHSRTVEWTVLDHGWSRKVERN